MKKVLLLLTVFCITFSVGAQTKEQIVKSLDKAKAASVHAKRSLNPSTWIKLSDAYANAYNAPKTGIMLGLSSVETKLLLRDQKVLSSEIKEVSGETYTVDTYYNKALYYNPKGQLEIIQITKPFVKGNLLGETYTALMKAAELDVKGSRKEEIKTKLLLLKNYYIDEAMNFNKLGDIKGANKYFVESIKTTENPIVNQIDSLVNYYVGLTFNMLKDYDNAKIYFVKCKDLGYYQDGDVISYLAEILKTQGDPEGAKELLAFGFEKFPSSQTILVSLINAFNDTNDDPTKVLGFIKVAQENEPKNASLYYAEGNVHLKLGKMDEAVKSFYMSAEIDSTYYYGVYTVGSTYFDRAIEMQQEMTDLDINDIKGYDALNLEFEKYLIMAIKPFERAFVMAKDDADFRLAIAEALKQIYFRFRDKSSEYKAGLEMYEKYLEDNAPTAVEPEAAPAAL